MTQTSVNELAALLPLLVQLVGLVFAVLVDSYLYVRQRRLLYVVVALAFGLIIQNFIEYRLALRAWLVFPRTIAAICGYAIRPAILAMFCYIVSPARRHWPEWLLVGVNATVHATALFSRAVFWIDAENVYHRGPLGLFCVCISGILLARLLVFTIREYRDIRKQEIVIPVFIVLIIIGAFLLDASLGSVVQVESFLTIAVVSCCVFYYIWLHAQFVREHERALQAEQRIQIMMSQIQPHFLFNTISTISALCHTAPEKAARISETFGMYLRQNLKTLGTVGLVPFREELAHTQAYTDIEMTRFETMRLEYDIQDCDFSVPPLTLQPIVENAIRHGARTREDGVVRVCSRRTESAHEITVWDNGGGFDPKSIREGDSGHIGFWNVRERLERMCMGTMSIESGPEQGTTVTIHVPLELPDDGLGGDARARNLR